MKITHLTTLKHKLQWLLLLAALLGVSHSVWANYYVYGGSTSYDVKNWTSPVTSSTSWNSFTINLAGKSINTDYFYGITTNETSFLQNCSREDWNCHLPLRSNGNFGNVEISSYNTNGKCNDSSQECNYYLMKVRIGSATVQSLTISVTIHDQGIHNCDEPSVSVTAYAVSIAAVTNTTPTVETRSSSNITSNSAKLYGYITSIGTSNVSANGVKVYTDAACTQNERTFSATALGANTGSFNVAATGLSANTKYYYKAYATNSSGTSYGGVSSFTTSAITSTAPVVRWGVAPIIDGSKNLIPSAFIAKHGCENSSNAKVVKLKLYVKIGSDPTVSDYDQVYTFTTSDITTDEFVKGTIYPNITDDGIYVSESDEFLKSLTSSSELHMGWVAINDNETNNTSAMSDIAVINYQTCSGGISTVTITPASKQILSGSDVTFEGSVNSDASTPTWNWTVGGSSVSTSSSYTRSNIIDGFTLTLTATNSCGNKEQSETYTVCSNSIIGSALTLTASAGGTPKPIDKDLPNSTIVFTATLPTGKSADEWKWYIDNVLVASSTTAGISNAQSINFSSDYGVGDYTLKVVASGCPSADVEIEQTIKIRENTTPKAATETITACADENRVAITELFDPSPTSVTVKLNGTDVTSHFNYDQAKGYLYFTDLEQSSFESREYIVTSHKDGYSDADATLTLTFQKVIPSSTVTINTPSDNSTVADPYTAVTLRATIAIPAEGDKVLWSVSPNTASVSPVTTNSGSNAAFKGSGNPSGGTNKTYTVTARIQSSTCGVSESSATRNIAVRPIPNEGCNN